METVIRATIEKKEEEIRELEANNGKKFAITMLRIEIQDLEALLRKGGIKLGS